MDYLDPNHHLSQSPHGFSGDSARYSPTCPIRTFPSSGPWIYLSFLLALVGASFFLTFVPALQAQSLGVTPLDPIQPDPGLTFLMGLSWAMEGPDSPNFNRAVQALQGAAERNSRAAQSILGRMLIQTTEPVKFQTGVAWLKRATQTGDVHAPWLLAAIYQNGGPGISPDKDLTLSYLEIAANAGHQEATHALAHFYDHPAADVSDMLSAVKWYRQAALNGHTPSQLRLAYLYHTGLNVRRDLKEALHFYGLAMENQNLQATFNAAQIYDFGPPEIRDIPKAVELYKSAADLGHPDSQLYFAQKVLQGQFPNGSFDIALDYLKRAATAGSPRAQFQYGVIQIEMAQSKAEADAGIQAIQSAVHGGIVPATIELARIHFFGHSPHIPADIPKATQLYEKLALDGNKDAQALLGYIYQMGEGGIKQNFSTAASWYLKAAQDGVVEAQYNLGMLHLNGEGLNQSQSEALRWLTKAASSGHPLAALNLGVIYNKINDSTKAVEWFRKAAENGVNNAAYYLGIVFDESVRLQSAKRESLKWFRSAARSGNLKAQYSLAYRLMEESSPRENLVESYQWFKVAAAHGHPGAPDALLKLESTLLPAEIKRATSEANNILASSKP